MDTISLLKLAEWMNGYHEKLKKFIEDERIINGTKTLLSIYFNRTVENAENIV